MTASLGKIGALCAVALLTVSAASATPLTIDIGANQWFAWQGALDEAGGAGFWDQVSQDGSEKNIGYWLTNSGFFSGGMDGPGQLEFLGGADAGAPPSAFSFGFTISSLATMQLEIAGQAGTNELWFYNVDQGVSQQVFAGADTAGAATVLDFGAWGWNVGESFALEFRPAGSAASAYLSSVSGVNQSGRFAVFQGPDSFYIGVEDKTTGQLAGAEGGVGDYNDMIFRLTAVPEPSTYVLMLTGLGLAFAGRRWRHLKNRS